MEAAEKSILGTQPQVGVIKKNMMLTRTVSSVAMQTDQQNHTPTAISPLFPNPNSPRIFTNLAPKYHSPDPVPNMMTTSPTAILDSNWNYRNPSKSPENFSEKEEIFCGDKHSWEKLESVGIGLALVDSFNESNPCSKASTKRKVVFGSQLKIPANPFHTQRASSGGRLSMEEMELSENYTCVISHGPNPKTTHIFDDCIVDGEMKSFESTTKRKKKKEKEHCLKNPSSPSLDFLSLCYTCRKKLGQDTDIYMYRGEKAFCSDECRSQEMSYDGGEIFWP